LLGEGVVTFDAHLDVVGGISGGMALAANREVTVQASPEWKI
jgi:hypothetical protein